MSSEMISKDTMIKIHKYGTYYNPASKKLVHFYVIEGSFNFL